MDSKNACRRHRLLPRLVLRLQRLHRDSRLVRLRQLQFQLCDLRLQRGDLRRLGRLAAFQELVQQRARLAPRLQAVVLQVLQALLLVLEHALLELVNLLLLVLVDVVEF